MTGSVSSDCGLGSRSRSPVPGTLWSACSFQNHDVLSSPNWKHITSVSPERLGHLAFRVTLGVGE